MTQVAQYFLALAGSLRSILNLALGYDANSLEPTTGSVIKERVRQGSNIDTPNVNFSLYMQVWSLNFAMKFHNAPKWGYMNEQDKATIKQFCLSSRMEPIMANPDQYARAFVKAMKSIQTSEYGTIYETLVNILIYGLFTKREEIVGAVALTILDSLED